MYIIEREQISTLVSDWKETLVKLPLEMISQNRNNQNRTIKQILGHLIDSAVNNHHRIVRLQYNNDLNFPDYRQDNDRWIEIQDYQNENWQDLLSFWKLYNNHMVHIIGSIKEEHIQNTWTDFEGIVETLDSIVKGYLWHLKLHFGEIKELMY